VARQTAAVKRENLMAEDQTPP